MGIKNDIVFCETRDWTKNPKNGMFEELNNMVKVLNKGGIKVNPVYKPIYRPTMRKDYNKQ